MTRIKMLREEVKLGQAELASRLNVSQGTLSNWEAGRHVPDKESLFILADFFEVTTDYILEYSSQKERQYAKPKRLLLEYFLATEGILADSDHLDVIGEILSRLSKHWKWK